MRTFCGEKEGPQRRPMKKVGDKQNSGQVIAAMYYYHCSTYVYY